MPQARARALRAGRRVAGSRKSSTPCTTSRFVTRKNTASSMGRPNEMQPGRVLRRMLQMPRPDGDAVGDPEVERRHGDGGSERARRTEHAGRRRTTARQHRRRPGQDEAEVEARLVGQRERAGRREQQVERDAQARARRRSRQECRRSGAGGPRPRAARGGAGAPAARTSTRRSAAAAARRTGTPPPARSRWCPARGPRRTTRRRDRRGSCPTASCRPAR
jgi:hypothetical protein